MSFLRRQPSPLESVTEQSSSPRRADRRAASRAGEASRAKQLRRRQRRAMFLESLEQRLAMAVCGSGSDTCDYAEVAYPLGSLSPGGTLSVQSVLNRKESWAADQDYFSFNLTEDAIVCPAVPYFDGWQAETALFNGIPVSISTPPTLQQGPAVSAGFLPGGRHYLYRVAGQVSTAASYDASVTAKPLVIDRHATSTKLSATLHRDCGTAEIAATLSRATLDANGAVGFEQAPIDRNLPTWVLFHGRADSRDGMKSVAQGLLQAFAGDGEIPLTLDNAGAVRTIQPVGQVLVVDWSKGADDLGLAGADWIPAVGRFVAGSLKSLGVPGSNTNFVGHSWGSWAAYETAKNLVDGGRGPVQSIVALDPATDVDFTLPIGTNHYDQSRVNFASVSNRSLAFFTSDCGNDNIAGTAHDAIRVGTGRDRFCPLPSAVFDHGLAKDIYASLVKKAVTDASPIYQHFGLGAISSGAGLQRWKKDTIARKPDDSNSPKVFEAQLNVVGANPPNGRNAWDVVSLQYKDGVDGIAVREVDADGASSGRQVDAGANKTANARDLSSDLSGGREVKIDGFFGVVNREDWFKFMIAGGPGTATAVTFRLDSSDTIGTLVEIFRVTKNSRGETVTRRVTGMYGFGEIPEFSLLDGTYLIRVANPRTRDSTYSLSVTQSAADSTLFRGLPPDDSTGGTGTGTTSGGGTTSGDGDVLPPDSSGDGDGGANGGSANGDGAPADGGAGPLDYAPPVDLILAPNDGDAINVGWHRTDLESQTVIQSAPAGGEKVFFFWLTNNTSEPAQYVVTGSGRDEAGYIDYFDRELPLTDGNNITYAVASASGWTTPVVAPGSTISLRAHVHPAPGLQTGDEKPVLLTARQLGRPENSDTVRGIVRAIANRPPVLDEVGPIYFEPNEWSRTVTLTSRDGSGGPVTYYVGKVFSSDPATRQLIDRLGITEWMGDQGNTLGALGTSVRWLKAGDRRYYIEPSGVLREATGGPAIWSAGPVVEFLDRRYYDDPNLLFRPAAGTVTVQGDRLTATRYPGFSGEFIAYVYATTGGVPYGVTLRLFTTESADLLGAIPPQSMSHAPAQLKLDLPVQPIAPSFDDLNLYPGQTAVDHPELIATVGMFDEGAANWAKSSKITTMVDGVRDLGLRERWLRDSQSVDYYILPDGRVFRWHGAVERSALMTVLPSLFHRLPELLFAPPATARVVDDQLIVSPLTGFIGEFPVRVTARQGRLFDAESFRVTVTNAAPEIAPLDVVRVPRQQEEVVVTLPITDADGDQPRITVQVPAVNAPYGFPRPDLVVDGQVTPARAQLDGNRLTLTILPEFYGWFNVQVTADDGFAKTSRTIAVDRNPFETLALSGLDATYGRGGVATIASDSMGMMQANDLLIQADGRIVAGGGGLARFNADGSADASFGVGGLAAPSDYARTSIEALAEQDGRLLVGGSAFWGDSVGLNFTVASVSSTDGSRDFSFGNYGSRNYGYRYYMDDAVRDMTVASDGTIVVTGMALAWSYDVPLVRITPEGNLDSATTFRFNPDRNVFEYGTALAALPDGRMLVGGSTIAPGRANHDFAFAVVLPSGQLDTSFGVDGKVFTDFGADETVKDIEVLPDGRFLVAGEKSFDNGWRQVIVVARYLPDGRLDTTFGDSGRTTLHRFDRSFDRLGQIAARPDGSLVVAGSADASGHFIATVAQLDPHGRLDGLFGDAGWLAIDSPDGVTMANAVKIDDQNRIVVGGMMVRDGQWQLMTARFAGEGTGPHANRPPAVEILGPADSLEGDSVTLSAGVDDPDHDAVASYDWRVSDSRGQVIASSTAETWNFTFPDDGDFVVELWATDADGAVGSDAILVSASNVAPVANAGGVAGQSTAMNEGDSLRLIGSWTDVGADDTQVARWEIVDAAGNLVASADSSELTFTPRDNGRFIATLIVTDDDGGVGRDSRTIEVANAAPVANAGGVAGRATTMNEGDSLRLVGSWTDVGADDTQVARWEVVDAAGNLVASADSSELAFAPRDNGRFIATLIVTDDDGGVGRDSRTIDVANVAPVVDVVGATRGVRGQSLSFRATVSDASPSDMATGLDYQIDFGDGRSAAWCSTANLNAWQHAYSSSGVFSYRVTVRDKDGGETTRLGTVTIVGVDLQGTTLFVGGTSLSDVITISPNDASGALKVVVNSETPVIVAPAPSRIVVWAQAGDDSVSLNSTTIKRVAYAIAAPATLIGGDGNDTLSVVGSTAANVLSGNAGVDRLTGGAGADLLSGGVGADTLRGNNGDDFLLGDSFTGDDRAELLEVVLAELRTAPADVLARYQSAAEATTSGRLTLGSIELFDDAMLDDLQGQTGVDWHLDLSKKRLRMTKS